VHSRLRKTLSSRGPWLVALCFAMYSGQWLAVIGFLPAIYTGLGLGAAWSAPATALAAAVNMVGNVGGGGLLQRGAAPAGLLVSGFCAMALGAFVTFGGAFEFPPAIRYAGVLIFSMAGGMIPATLFSMAVRLAPDESTVSSTVGWVQQWSSTGQFFGPPLVAWVATRWGGWHYSWVVTGACAAVGCALAVLLAAALRRRAPPGA